MPTISIKISEIEKNKLQAAAEKHGVSLSKLLKDGGALVGGFTPYFLERLDHLAEAMGIKKSTIIENMIIARMARQISREEIFSVNDPLDEFHFTAKGPISGKELFKQLRTKYVSEFEDEMAVLDAKENRLTKSKAGK